MKFLGRFEKGGLTLGSAHNRARLVHYAKNNDGQPFELIPIVPESHKQRGFFEGAVVPLCTYYQENLDWQSSDDLRKMREALKIEFNGELIEFGGKVQKISKSTKGELNSGFLERVIEWMESQGYQTELLNPEEYKKWKVSIWPYGGPNTYIEYLKELKLLK